MKARYVHRITRADVGSRVSIRRWIDDPDRGPVPSDVVGRLDDWTEQDQLTIVTRAGERVTVAAASILSSRVIPAHPTLPPEPA